jgi:hypothetical protein
MSYFELYLSKKIQSNYRKLDADITPFLLLYISQELKYNFATICFMSRDLSIVQKLIYYIYGNFNKIKITKDLSVLIEIINSIVDRHTS